MTRWLDRVTGRFTTYRLMVFCLLALFVESLLVALTGQLAPYSALGILASAVVAVAVCYAANRLFAALFSVHAHSESAIITGLILFFLFRPLLDGPGLLALAVASVLAMASKYVLAIRQRHVFNPAAAGGFLAGLIFPFNAPTWWVATPWLLPLVTLAALVILYRTRHLSLGIVFVGVAAITVTMTFMASGETFANAVNTAFTSYPIVFLAGFMLSEPLTLPPRRWQQLGEAAIVGIIFGLIFHLGPVYSSPQLALLVGNLLAFFVGQRRGIRLEFLGKRSLTPTSWELSFRPRKPVAFAAGQFMELSLPHAQADGRGLRRTFSIASSPSSPEVVRFGIRVAERSSSFKTALLDVQPGEIVSGTAVGGDFVLPGKTTRPVLLVAGGIGITPFVSQLSHLTTTGEKRDVVLVYSSSSATEIAYRDELQTAGHPVLLVSPAQPADLPESWQWIGRGPLTAEMLLTAVPDATARTAYVSGAPDFVRNLKPALRKAGVRHVRSDYFTGY
jgi:ferredoxin-NADP reductase